MNDNDSSEVMRASMSKGFFDGGLGFVISIKAVYRTLDFEIDEEVFRNLFQGLRLLAMTQTRISSPREALSSAAVPN